METDDREIAPCLTNGRMAPLHGLPTGKLPATEGKDRNRSPPAAPITEHAHLTEGLQSTPREEDGKTLGCVRAYVDEVKGKMTSHSNELSAIICYFTEVSVYQTGDQCG